jgi:hypothetical protein
LLVVESALTARARELRGATVGRSAVRGHAETVAAKRRALSSPAQPLFVSIFQDVYTAFCRDFATKLTELGHGGHGAAKDLKIKLVRSRTSGT